jgi:hypothetical protein
VSSRVRHGTLRCLFARLLGFDTWNVAPLASVMVEIIFFNDYSYVSALLDLVAYRVVLCCRVVFENLAVKLLRKALFQCTVKGSPFVSIYEVTFTCVLYYVACAFPEFYSE